MNHNDNSVFYSFSTDRFTVRARHVPDDDLDLSWDDDGTVQEGLESNRLVAFGVIVECLLDESVLASDSLWGCFYTSPKAFIDHWGLRPYSRAKSKEHGQTIVCGSYFSDMVRIVCRDARNKLDDMKNIPLRSR